MNSLNLPEHELFVSRAEEAGDDLSVRLLSEYFPDQDRYGRAFTIVARGCSHAHAMAEFFQRMKDEGSAVYVEISDTQIAAYSEDGQPFDCSFSSIGVTESDLDNGEMSDLVRQLRSWYDQESAALRELRTAISAASTKIRQQTQRLETKSSTHEADSTAGLLYRQQIEFLSKVLRAIDV